MYGLAYCRHRIGLEIRDVVGLGDMPPRQDQALGFRGCLYGPITIRNGVFASVSKGHTYDLPKVGVQRNSPDSSQVA